MTPYPLPNPPNESLSRRLFACPYYKLDALRYSECIRYQLESAIDVREHLLGRHVMGPYCHFCHATFETHAARDGHMRELSCVINLNPVPRGLSEDQRAELRGIDILRRATEEARWFDMWTVAFPELPWPSTCYVDSENIPELPPTSEEDPAIYGHPSNDFALPVFSDNDRAFEEHPPTYGYDRGTLPPIASEWEQTFKEVCLNDVHQTARIPPPEDILACADENYTLPFLATACSSELLSASALNPAYPALQNFPSGYSCIPSRPVAWQPHSSGNSNLLDMCRSIDSIRNPSIVPDIDRYFEKHQSVPNGMKLQPSGSLNMRPESESATSFVSELDSTCNSPDTLQPLGYSDPMRIVLEIVANHLYLGFRSVNGGGGRRTREYHVTRGHHTPSGIFHSYMPDTSRHTATDQRRVGFFLTSGDYVENGGSTTYESFFGHDESCVSNSGTPATSRILASNKADALSSRPPKRKRGDDDDDEGSRKRMDRPSSRASDRCAQKLFACPFWKSNPDKHRRCFKNNVYIRLADVKQHVRRKHLFRKDPCCQRCWVQFPDDTALQLHVAQIPQDCELFRRDYEDGIVSGQDRELSRRAPRGSSEEQAWFRMWDIVFPDRRSRPGSAYIDAELSEDANSMFDYFQRNGERVYREQMTIAGNPLRSGEEEESDFSRVFDQMMENLRAEWLSRRRGIAEAPRRTDFNADLPLTYTPADSGIFLETQAVAPESQWWPSDQQEIDSIFALNEPGMAGFGDLNVE